MTDIERAVATAYERGRQAGRAEAMKEYCKAQEQTPAEQAAANAEARANHTREAFAQYMHDVFNN